jgi:hypothetical protein
LNDIGGFFGVGNKMEHSGSSMWKRCMEGDPGAWKEMKKYNAKDVTLLERIYLKMRPYITNHPNLALLIGHLTACPNCYSDNVHRKGYWTTRVMKSERYQCADCGAWSHRPLSKAERAELYDKDDPKQLR